MNRLRILLVTLLLAGVMVGCYDEVNLYPYELPDLVQSYIRKVECDDDHNAVFIASDDGVLILLGEEQYIFNAKDYAALNSINWDNSRVLYAPTTEVFWVIQDTSIYQLGRGIFRDYYDKTKFFAPTKSYVSYAISPEGDLYRSSFYKEFWDGDPNNFYSDYYIGIYKFLGFPNNAWEAYETDMTINSQQLATPSFTFQEDGSLLFFTNPSYIATSLTTESSEFELIPKSGQAFDFRSGMSPHVHEGKILAVNRNPSLLLPYDFVYSSSISEMDVLRVEALADCSLPPNNQGAVKLLGWQGTVAVGYVGYFTNALSTENSQLGFIISTDALTGECDVTPLMSNDVLRYSESITDLDIIDETVYIGTRNGLLLYDIQTGAIESYLMNLLLSTKGE